VVMYGADPDQLDELARKIKILGDALAKCHGPVDVQVQIAPWQGPSADRFRHDWARTHRPAILNAAHSLQHAQEVLIRNANEQRKASGVEAPTSHDGGTGGLFHGITNAVDGVTRAAVHDVADATHDVGAALRDVQDGLSAVVHSETFGKIVNSEAFGEVLVAAQILSTIAPIVAIIPVVGPVAAAGMAVGASAVVLVGHAAQMANTGRWDVKKLGMDAASVALSGVGFGAAKGALEGASVATKAFKEAADVSLLSKANITSLSAGARAIVGVRTVAEVFTVEAGATDVIADVRKGDYLGAASDTFGVVAGSLSTGSGSDGPVRLVDAVSAEFGVASTFKDIPEVAKLVESER
jgi:hypothetical protein